ncbi:MAG TPA: sulfotransferase, partial [Methylomirabilota bacterium]|nr:sulfotransferase [Methylomirabilota bacterium]
VRAEDVMADPRKALGPVCQALGVEVADSLATPSWNGAALEEIYPWGTIRKATPDANRATALTLSEAERAEIRERTWQYLEAFDYKSFL